MRANNIPVATFTVAISRPYLNKQGEREADFMIFRKMTCRFKVIG